MIPEFKGQTSVCSTPMTDLNKILHGRAMSICGEIEIKDVENKDPKQFNKADEFENDLSKLKMLQDGFLNINKYKRRNSLPDLRKKQIMHKGFPMRTYGFGLSKFKFENNEDACDDSDDSYLKRNRTLSEPCYNNMTSDFILENPIEKLDLEVTKKINKDKPKKEILSKPSPKEVDTSIKFSSVLDKSKMTLPLKSHTPIGPGPVPLTPLMSKLSILSALQDSIYDFTPTDAQDKSSICNTPISSVINSDLNHSEAFGGRVRSHLLICGQRDMTLLLILEDGAGYNEQLITEMVSISVIIN